jgi:hypothetical protein
MLHKQGAIIDGTGRVASRIREYFTIPDTKTINTQISEVLGLMEQTKLITRSMNEGRTRTYGIELVEQLTADAAEQLEAAQGSNVALFIGAKTESSEVNLVELTRQCQLAYRELQGAAARAPRRDTSGRVAINAAGVLKAVGIGTVAAKPLRYYLKELGLIRSHNQCDDTNAQLWWWTISAEPIDVAKLRDLASGDRSFEAAQERRKRERTGTPEASPVTIRRIGEGVTSPGSQGTEDKVTTEQQPPALAPKPSPRPSRPPADAQPIQTVEDPMEALLGIIAKLKAQLADQSESHAKELAAKDERIDELQQLLASRRATDARVSAVIAEFSNE